MDAQLDLFVICSLQNFNNFHLRLLRTTMFTYKLLLPKFNWTNIWLLGSVVIMADFIFVIWMKLNESESEGEIFLHIIKVNKHYSLF